MRLRGIAFATCIASCQSTPSFNVCPEHLPNPPSAPQSDDATKFTYALDSILLGDMARGSQFTSTTAWKGFGLNLDGLVTDARSADVCTRGGGAPSSVQVDGFVCNMGGIDNSFGANVIPIFQSADSDPTPSTTFTNLIRSGAFTLQLEIAGLDLSTMSQSSIGLTAQSFASSTFDPVGGSRPTFATSEDWPVLGDLHPDPQTGASFSLAYIDHGTFVARDANLVLSTMHGPRRRLDLHIHHAIVVMDVRGDRAENGALAGVLNVEEFIDDVRSFATAITKSFCDLAFDGIAQQLRQCADILDDGTNRAGKPCNAISLGIGFTARRIANPKRSLPPPVILDPCRPIDAGVDASSDSAVDAPFD